MRNILICTLLCTALVTTETETMNCKDSRVLDDTCGVYCFQALKPILAHTTMLQEQHNQPKMLQQAHTLTQPDLESIKSQLSIVIEQTSSLHHSKRRPSAFQKIDSKYYYIERKYPINWFGAAHKCHEMGSHLASLKNEKEHTSLKAHLDPNVNYWIDINDLSKEGQFLSLTTGSAPEYLNWQPGNPDNENNNEHCVGLWNYEKNLLMNDFVCADTLPYVCELFD